MLAKAVPKEQLMALTNKIFFYVASAHENDFDVPESLSTEEDWRNFASSLSAFIAERHEIDDEEASSKVQRIIDSFLFG